DAIAGVQARLEHRPPGDGRDTGAGLDTPAAADVWADTAVGGGHGEVVVARVPRRGVPREHLVRQAGRVPEVGVSMDLVLCADRGSALLHSARPLGRHRDPRLRIVDGRAATYGCLVECGRGAVDGGTHLDAVAISVPPHAQA